MQWYRQVSATGDHLLTFVILLIPPLFSYTTRDDALATGLVYVQGDGTVIMHGDNTTWLDKGVPRRRSVLLIFVFLKY